MKCESKYKPRKIKYHQQKRIISDESKEYETVKYESSKVSKVVSSALKTTAVILSLGFVTYVPGVIVSGFVATQKYDSNKLDSLKNKYRTLNYDISALEETKKKYPEVIKDSTYYPTLDTLINQKTILSEEITLKIVEQNNYLSKKAFQSWCGLTDKYK
jgi:hypothetical protein